MKQDLNVCCFQTIVAFHLSEQVWTNTLFVHPNMKYKYNFFAHLSETLAPMSKLPQDTIV